jgi:hypothetical protein
MKQETEDKIVAEFPEYFPDFRGDPTKTCLAWGLAVGEGWSNLFHQLCRDIKATNPPEGFKFEQVKEKFGGLRVYASGGTSEIGKLIDAAENDSYTICENCGTKEGVKSEGAWITTLCGNCRGTIKAV